MSVSTILDQWKNGGAISAAQHDAIAALVRKDRVSVFVELNTLLYLGVLSFVAGVGWTVATYSGRLGDAAILLSLSAVFAWSLHDCFTRGVSYSHQHVEQPGLAFDYVLYLGCLVFGIALGYLESRFHPFQENWDHSLLLASAVFVALAYRFDNRLVLSLALSSLAAWCGVRLSRFGLLSGGGELRTYALAYGAFVAAAGAALHRAGVKKHPGDDYGILQAAAWAGVYLALNVQLQLPWDSQKAGRTFYWITYVAIWVLPPIGLRLAIPEKDRELMDISLVLALITLVTNKLYLGWPRYTWDPMLLGLVLIGVAIAMRRWLAAGPAGERHGFTPARLLERDRAMLTMLRTASVALQPGQPSGASTSRTEPEAPQFVGGRSRGGGGGDRF